jgi:predicted RNA binding protein YcfA (HicA-like mRNA interferase family)
LRHLEKLGRVTVPVYAGETILPKTLGRILADAGLSAEQLRELL